MSHSNYSTNSQFIKAGRIEIKVDKKGKIKLYSFNHQRGKPLHIGSIIGATFEKVSSVLRSPEPSFSLSQSELATVEECGAQFVRIITPDKSGTWAISLQDFKRNAQPYYNAAYGPQKRVALVHFENTSQVGERNPISDNPPIATRRDIIEERRVAQLELFHGQACSISLPKAGVAAPARGGEQVERL